MKITSPTTARKGGASAHRPGGIGFTYLIEGDEGAVDNFCLMLVHVEDRYTAPRHRHNFEQVRVILDGAFGFGPGRRQNAGSIGYFCEGTYYEQEGQGPSTTLLLQVAGASGDGYMSARQMHSGVQALQGKGSFNDGVFQWLDADGKKHNVDGYQAAWEYVPQRKMRYSKPRYDGPILLEPQNFSWVPCDGGQMKHLGTFNERGLRLSMRRVDQGAGIAFESAQRSLVYILVGSGRCSGSNVEQGDALDIAPGEKAIIALNSSSHLELLIIELPNFDDEARALRSSRSMGHAFNQRVIASQATI